VLYNPPVAPAPQNREYLNAPDRGLGTIPTVATGNPASQSEHITGFATKQEGQLVAMTFSAQRKSTCTCIGAQSRRTILHIGRRCLLETGKVARSIRIAITRGPERTTLDLIRQLHVAKPIACGQPVRYYAGTGAQAVSPERWVLIGDVANAPAKPQLVIGRNRDVQQSETSSTRRWLRVAFGISTLSSLEGRGRCQKLQSVGPGGIWPNGQVGLPRLAENPPLGFRRREVRRKLAKLPICDVLF